MALVEAENRGLGQETRVATREESGVLGFPSRRGLTPRGARLQQYVNRKLPDVLAGFRKGRGARDQIANIHWKTEKARELQKSIYFCFIDYAKAFDCVDEILRTSPKPRVGQESLGSEQSILGMWQDLEGKYLLAGE